MSKSSQQLKRLILGGLLLAITVVFGRIFIIPIPWTHGNINLCDAGIFIAAMLLGPAYGTVVGGLGGMLLDLISGFTQYSIFSLIAHGLEGLVAGLIYQHFGNRKLGQWLALIIGTLVMVAGYFIADSVLYTYVAGLLGIGTNLLQGIVGAIVAMLVVPAIKKRI
ncbi:ECF transporter S component [uncultured Limosilactobacillus sp.]|uniref:ECF transporter S component n=1 Tax=uncultured Limosilactobacillus sp. TaxID=2837629 RepID=UPI0025FBE143|nr:ECF transporter S component [uncultured Limosilactobacillus sp.]